MWRETWVDNKCRICVTLRLPELEFPHIDQRWVADAEGNHQAHGPHGYLRTRSGASRLPYPLLTPRCSSTRSGFTVSEIETPRHVEGSQQPSLTSQLSYVSSFCHLYQ